MWFINNLYASLEHKPIDIEGKWEPQWEYNYTFNINKKGNFKLAFLLFTEETEQFNTEFNYKDIAEDRINNSYREIHLYLNVT
jgi:hypothetical protein